MAAAAASASADSSSFSSPPLLPIVSAVGVTAAGKSAVAVSLAQSLSAPYSFFEYHRMASSNNLGRPVTSPVDAQPGQIIAVGVRPVTVRPLEELCTSDIQDTLLSSTHDSNWRCVILSSQKRGNVFLANDCLVAVQAFTVGDSLVLLEVAFDALSLKAAEQFFRYATPAVRAEHGSQPCGNPELEIKRFGATGDTLVARTEIEQGTKIFQLEGWVENKNNGKKIGSDMDLLGRLSGLPRLDDSTLAQALYFPMPTVYTIAVSPGMHRLIDDGAQCLAHHCDPNTHVKVDPATGAVDVIAIKPIAAGDVVSFNYLTTEFSMDQPFNCSCGAAGCYGKIAGYGKLDAGGKARLMQTGTVSPVILTLDAAPGGAVPFVVHKHHPILRGTIISPKVWRGSNTDAASFVRDGTSRFDFSTEQPNACLMSLRPLQHPADCSEWMLVALMEIPAGGSVRVRPPDLHRQNSSVMDMEKVAAHIINIDVMQALDGLPIATNKPLTAAAQGHVPHYMLGSHPPRPWYKNGLYQSNPAVAAGGIHGYVQEVLRLIADIRVRNADWFDRSSLIILCGGTLYYQLALLVQGVIMKEVNQDQDQHDGGKRSEAAAADGGAEQDNDASKKDEAEDSDILWNRLNELAPEVAQRYHPNDTRRIQRQIEIALDGNQQQQQPQQKRLRNFSGTAAEPEPVLLWVHQGYDREDFVRNQIARRVEKMRRAGLLGEVFYHVPCGFDYYDGIFDHKDGERSTLVDERRREVLANVARLENSTAGINSAIGFKEVVRSVVEYMLDTVRAPTREELGIPVFEPGSEEEELYENAAAPDHELFFKETVRRVHTALESLQNDDPDSISPKLRAGLDRLATATWRYAQQQDQWLRRKFVPLRKEGLLRCFVAVTPACDTASSGGGDGGGVNRKQQLCRDAFLAVTDAIQISMETRGPQHQQVREPRFDVLRILPDLNDNNSDDDDDEGNSDGQKKPKTLFRCKHCDKAMVGEDQWAAHCSTKAHRRNVNRVEPTPQQIERWKAEGEGKRMARRRDRGGDDDDGDDAAGDK